MNIGKTFRDRLGIRQQINYQNHKDTMVKSGSTTKATYTL